MGYDKKTYIENRKNKLLEMARETFQIGGLEIGVGDWLFMLDNGGNLIYKNLAIGEVLYLHELNYHGHIFNYLTTDKVS